MKTSTADMDQTDHLGLPPRAEEPEPPSLEARLAEAEREIADTEAGADILANLFREEMKRAEAAEARLAEAERVLREIEHMCAAGYYGPGGHDYATETKRLARAYFAAQGGAGR